MEPPPELESIKYIKYISKSVSNIEHNLDFHFNRLRTELTTYYVIALITIAILLTYPQYKD